MSFFVVVAAVVLHFVYSENVEPPLMLERLPNDTIPISYNINIVTNVHNGEEDYNGTVEIMIAVEKDTQQIVLHSKGHSNIKLNLLDLKSELYYDNLIYVLNNNTDQLMIKSKTNSLNLTAGNRYVLTISFQAKLCVHSKGFCLMYDQNDLGQEIPLAASHLSKGVARRAFPCYDEPALKAKYSISITHAKNYTAYSNMPAIGSPIQSSDNYVTTRFMETPPISTYIVAFAIVAYEKQEIIVGDTRIGLIRPLKSKGGDLALELSRKALPIMNSYFEIPYYLPKLDHLSLPALYARGMENLGLIVYSKGVLLGDSEIFKDVILQNANTIVHEITHMWLGNLVTFKWWSYYWLSEGLTSFYGAKFLDKIKPEWKVMEQAVVQKFSDAVWEYHDLCSLTCPINTWEELFSSTGIQAYGKAAFLLRMFENALSEKVFRRGIINYLQKFQYSSATETDLFDSLQKAVEDSDIHFFKDKSLSKAMQSWTSKIYYPIINVFRNFENNTFTIEQIHHRGNSSANNEWWWIPVSFSTQSSPDVLNTEIDFINPGEQFLDVNPNDFGKQLRPEDWLIVNKEQFGMFRVNYDDKNWMLIICALMENPNVYPSLTKYQILRDAEFFFREGFMSFEMLLNLLNYLQNETDTLTWHSAALVLTSINVAFPGGDVNSLFNNFIKDIVVRKFIELETELKDKDIPMDNILRPILFDLACSVGLPECVESAKRSLENVEENKDKFSYQQIRSIYCYGSMHANEEEFRNIINQLVEVEMNYKIEMVAYCIENRKNLQFLINATVNNETSEYYSGGAKTSFLVQIARAQNIGLSVILDMFLNNDLEIYQNVEEDLIDMAKFIRNHHDKELFIRTYTYVAENATNDQISTINNEAEVSLENYEKENEQKVVKYVEPFLEFYKTRTSKCVK